MCEWHSIAWSCYLERKFDLYRKNKTVIIQGTSLATWPTSCVPPLKLCLVRYVAMNADIIHMYCCSQFSSIGWNCGNKFRCDMRTYMYVPKKYFILNRKWGLSSGLTISLPLKYSKRFNVYRVSGWNIKLYLCNVWAECASACSICDI